MSENNIDNATDSEAAAVAQEPETAEALMSAEAKRYRLRLRDSETQNAELVTKMADTAARAEAAERQVIEANLRGRFADMDDFWGQTDLNDLRGEDGSLDPARVSSRADTLLDAHPHWKAPNPGAPLAASTGAIGGGAGRIGFGPRSVLDGDTVQPSQPRGWGEFFSDAVKGTV